MIGGVLWRLFRGTRGRGGGWWLKMKLWVRDRLRARCGRVRPLDENRMGRVVPL